MVNRDEFLNDKDNENFFDLNSQFSISNDNDFNRFHRNLIEAVESDRKQWMLIHEVRNSEKIKSRIYSLRNLFGDYVTQTKKIANRLNYRFSTHGNFHDPQYLLQISGICNPKQKVFSSYYVTEKDFHDAIRALGKNKPIRPSNLPAWANKESSSVVVPHLNFLVKYCI